mmetsp:Transcript_5643/g.13088  ORF Transcript_5643/g.13088 Transcript_5643/m.13088 type:complete len:84 (+) Transcript_5643:833-1084(+)
MCFFRLPSFTNPRTVSARSEIQDLFLARPLYNVEVCLMGRDSDKIRKIRRTTPNQHPTPSIYLGPAPNRSRSTKIRFPRLPLS